MNGPLAEMFRYNRWANRVLLGACRQLPEELLEATAPGHLRNVRQTVLHLVGGQQTFVLRTMGRQHEGELQDTDAWPGWDAVIEIANTTSDELIAIAEAIDADSEVQLPHGGQKYRFPKSFFLAHAIAHGVEHRTEIKIALAGRGIETPELDAWDYSDDAGYGAAV
jgi:uncharacterized damage-inducible protein DinB